MKTENNLETVLSRKQLVDTLRNLLTDQFDADEICSLTDCELMQKIIDAAVWYQNECLRYSNDYK